MSLFDDDQPPRETAQQRALRLLREKRIGHRRRRPASRLRFLLALILLAVAFAWAFGYIDPRGLTQMFG